MDVFLGSRFWNHIIWWPLAHLQILIQWCMHETLRWFCLDKYCLIGSPDCRWRPARCSLGSSFWHTFRKGCVISCFVLRFWRSFASRFALHGCRFSGFTRSKLRGMWWKIWRCRFYGSPRCSHKGRSLWLNTGICALHASRWYRRPSRCSFPIAGPVYAFVGWWKINITW